MLLVSLDRVDRFNTVEPLALKEFELLDGTVCTGVAGVSSLDARMSFMDMVETHWVGLFLDWLFREAR